MRLLAAENKRPLAAFLRRGLDAEHYSVDLAGDGEEAERLAEENEYDLLIQEVLAVGSKPNRSATAWPAR